MTATPGVFVCALDLKCKVLKVTDLTDGQVYLFIQPEFTLTLDEINKIYDSLVSKNQTDIALIK